MPVRMPVGIFGNDKFYHIIAYAFLIFPIALENSNKWKVFGVLFLVYSGWIEWLQPLFNRDCSPKDFEANLIGIVCGFIIARTIMMVRLKESKL